MHLEIKCIGEGTKNMKEGNTLLEEMELMPGEYNNAFFPVAFIITHERDKNIKKIKHIA
jgi:hypothetical protein